MVQMMALVSMHAFNAHYYFYFFNLFTFTRHALAFVAWKAIQWERRVLR